MSVPTAQASNTTVFVVDDDNALRKALCRMLAGAGFTTQDFVDGASFLAAIKSDTSGCVVLDQAMPGMTGLQLLEQMQLLGVRLPSILLTGSGSRSVESQANAFGIMAYLDKPVAGERLLECVRQALARAV